MERKAIVYVKNKPAGILENPSRNSFIFEYLDEYIHLPETPSLCLSMPKRREPYRSEVLFPYFESILPEGDNLVRLCRLMHIDEEDRFAILLASAGRDSIGSVTLSPLEA